MDDSDYEAKLPEPEIEEPDEESDAECFDSLDTCQELALKDLKLRGLHNFSVVRNMDTWSDEVPVLRDFAQYGDVARLPKVSANQTSSLGGSVCLRL